MLWIAGNICRSPISEALFLELLEKKGERNSVSLNSTHNTIFRSDTKNVTGGAKVKSQLGIEPRPSGVPCQCSKHWGIETWYDMLSDSHSPVYPGTLT